MSSHFVLQSTIAKDAMVMAHREGQRFVVMRIMQIIETTEAQMHALIKETHNENISNTE